MMNPVSFALILTGVLLNACAQLLLKAGTNAVGHFEFHLANVIPVGLRLAFQPYILTGMGCYAVSLVVWIMALSRVPVSVAYPMLSIGYVVNAFVAYLWFGEALASQKLLGIGFIVVGVWLVAKS
jgi:multidrug transporter EmrE-like cation transporter